MGRGDGQAIIKTSRPETSRCTYKLNPGIRERIAQYDTIPMSPALGEHGNAPELPQFFLGDDNIEASMLLTEQDILRRIK
nr:YqcI/YcgG family protein [Bifidobacterium longum]